MLFDQETVERFLQTARQDDSLAQGLRLFEEECAKKDSAYVQQILQRMQKERQRAEQYGGPKHMRYGNTVRSLAEDCLKLAVYCRVSAADQEETKNSLKQAILAVCGVEEWVFQGKVDGAFNADLWTGDITVSLSLAYDTVSELFTQEEKETIEYALLHKGILPIYQEWVDPTSHRHALDTMGHNWWLVIVCGAGVALLTLQNHVAQYQTLLDEILEGVREWFAYPGNVLQNKKANFGPDGDYIEFVSYLSYALSNYVLFEELYRQKYGVGELFQEEILKKLVDFYLVHFQVLESGVQEANFGDTPLRQTGHLHVFFYLAKRFQRPDLLRMLSGMCGPMRHPYVFYFYPEEKNEHCPIKAPLQAVYHQAGYAVIRTGYEAKDTFFAIKTGGSWGHNHRDVGTFLLSAAGQEIAVDSGTCTYSRPEHGAYYLTPQAHNVVLFNDKGQDYDCNYCGTKYAGGFPSLLSFGDFTYLLADCTGPYAGTYQRFYRHILFLNGIILMIDDLHAFEEGELSWLLHYKGEVENQGERYRIHQNDQTTALLYPLYPCAPKASIENGLLSEIKPVPEEDGILPPAHYLKLSSPTHKRRGKLIHAFVLPGNEDAVLEQKVDGAIIEITVRRGSYTEHILCNTRADGSVMHRNANYVYQNIASDAFLVYWREKALGTLTHVGMINGSMLTMNGKLFCSSLQKFDGIFSTEDRQFSANATASIRLHVGGAQKPIQLQNGGNQGSY